MIDFQPIVPENRERYAPYLELVSHRGCGFSFANLSLWGHQWASIVDGFLVIFSHYTGHTMYPFPAGTGDVKPVLDRIIADSKKRGIPCRISGVTAHEKEILEEYYPGQWRYHCDRDNFDYVYDINDLAELKGKKYQPKRNHVNRFLTDHPDSYILPLDEVTMADCRAFTDRWFARRQEEDPDTDYFIEQRALAKAYEHYRELNMEGLVLYTDGKLVAMTMGSFLSEDMVDVHFEKADSDYATAYAVINRAFARYLRDKYPQLKYLDREEDMGSPGLRKAKLSYQPHHLVEKCWAHYAGEEYK